jgi:hypothetical protein
MFSAMTIDTNDSLVKRAIAAYFRTKAASPEMPSDSGVTELDGKTYVVLENASRILAVYRVRNDGMLKRLRRWPIELDTLCASDRASGQPEGRWVQGEDLQAQQMRVHWTRESEFNSGSAADHRGSSS